MAAEDNKTFDDLVKETCRFVDVRFEEFKLKTTRGLSTALGQVLSYVLIIAVLLIVLSLLALALLQWLNALLGSPWGTLLVAGVFTIAILVLMLCRHALFKDLFIKLFINIFYNSDSDEQVQ